MQRRLRGISQATLSEGLGVSFQQVQKYEKGTNRVGSSRLQGIAIILGIPISFFFEDGPRAVPDAQPDMNADNDIVALFNTAEGLALSRAFSRIEDPNVRRKFVGLATALAAKP
ncbi:helix-turn-helix transcriptional regulator [Rhizobium herbae]|uniref:Helix-turn-helix transcriptional regulator n=1 Tax=Rhizobium herbae TaxID=508661 RepID=A0ABS7HBS2_9HYPH|nr:helix-turn-helix transcriptional regulator [Rhizobium herbae]MBW9064661.1 helix-turn-helix transcriptional regulator [Rhizobium herbae]